MKKIYLYFHNDLDGILSCVLAFHLFKAMNFNPIIAEAVIPEELEDKKKKLKEPFAILDCVYRKDALAYFDHHAMNRPKKISKKTKFWAFDEKAKCCAEIIYAYAKKRKIKLPDDKALKKLIYWAKIIDAALYADYGIKAIETIKPKLAATKINLALESGSSVLIKQIVKTLIKKPSLENVAKQDFIKKYYNKILSLREKSLKAFKGYSHYDPKVGLVTYDATSFHWDRFASVVIYPKSFLGVGLVKIKGNYFIKISKNPWNKKLSEKIEKLDAGAILREVGGGGHKIVGSALFPSYKEAKEALKYVLSKINAFLK